MAVIQISKIQIRRGLATAEGLPQLASGEMGWAIDEQRLFIGNGSVAEGAPAVGNTEVLTESRMFELLSDTRFTATNYTYMGHFTATSIVTGPDENTPVVRTLQQKLDDNVNGLDFGIEEYTDIGSALQRALTALYNNTDKDLPRSRVPFRIPAGEYYLGSTVQVPPFVTLVGDGIDKTVLIATGTNTTIFETVDSDGNTGLEIESAKQPRHIDVSGMTIKYGTETSITTSTPLLILNGITDSRFSNVKFAGNYNSGLESTTTYTAVLLGGTLTRDVHFHDCEFTDICYPAIANDDMEYISFEDNRFSGLFQGLTFANDLQGSSPSQYGPRNVDIKNNKFINIERQAIYAGANTRDNNQINSEGNSFENVGNRLNEGDENPLYPIITMLSHGNSTVNDDFQRLWNAQKTNAAISQKPIIEGTVKVEINTTDKRVLSESTQTETLIRIPYDNTVTSITVDYTLEKASVIRKGTLSIVGYGSATSCRDTYNVAGLSDGETIFSAELVDTETLGNVDTLAVKYDNPVSSGEGTIVFNVSYYK